MILIALKIQIHSQSTRLRIVGLGEHRDDRAPSLRFGMLEKTLPTPRLQHIRLRHRGHRQPLHGPDQVLADFK
jgi:hypothetical protein